MLRVTDVFKSFEGPDGDLPILKGISLTASTGQTVALTGESGSGKSTLLHLVGGLDQPDAGQIEIDGQDIGALDDAGRAAMRRDKIGVVFQQFNLIPSLTVASNIAFQARLAGREDKAWTDDLAARMGLGDQLAKYPEQLSGGQQQRVAIARTLAARPSLILADEPTGNLDFRTAEVVMDVLEKQVHDRERTMLIATHDKDIISLADRVFMLHEGLIKEISPSEAMGPTA